MLLKGTMPNSQPPADTDVSKLLDAIHGGILDKHLDGIIDEISERRKMIARLKLRLFEPGDRVRVNSHIRPKYLEGITGTIRGFYNKTIEVDLDPHQYTGRYNNSRLKFYANSLDRLVPTDPAAKAKYTADRDNLLKEIQAATPKAPAKNLDDLLKGDL
jgi:hypothetical protein